MLDRVLQLQMHCGSGKLAAASADQLTQFAATLHSPLLHAQALLRRATLSFLTDDVASAAADLDQAQTSPDEERDVLVVQMRCLLGMLAAKLGLRLEAHAHFVAAQAKLGVFSELYRDVLEPCVTFVFPPICPAKVLRLFFPVAAQAKLANYFLDCAKSSNTTNVSLVDPYMFSAC